MVCPGEGHIPEGKCSPSSRQCTQATNQSGSGGGTLGEVNPIEKGTEGASRNWERIQGCSSKITGSLGKVGSVRTEPTACRNCSGPAGAAVYGIKGKVCLHPPLATVMYTYIHSTGR